MNATTSITVRVQAKASLRAELEDRQARRDAAEAPRRARIAKLSTR